MSVGAVRGFGTFTFNEFTSRPLSGNNPPSFTKNYSIEVSCETNPPVPGQPVRATVTWSDLPTDNVFLERCSVSVSIRRGDTSLFDGSVGASELGTFSWGAFAVNEVIYPEEWTERGNYSLNALLFVPDNIGNIVGECTISADWSVS